MHIVEPLLEKATIQPNKMALIHGANHRTYAQLVRAMKRISGRFQQEGVGERVAILAHNCIEFVEVFLGAVHAGFIPIILDPKWSERERKLVIQQAEPKVVFTENSFIKSIATSQAIVVPLTSEAIDAWIGPIGENAPVLKNADLFVGFTSGSTGVPKGYVRTHQSWVKSFEATVEAFGLKTDGDFLAPGPFVQSLSLFALMQSLYFGSTAYIVSSFTVEAVLDCCRRANDVTLFVVPTMIERMLQTVQTPLHVQAVICSGAKWSEQSKKRARTLFPSAKFIEFYGSSEASYISYLHVTNDSKEQAVGRIFPHVQVQLVDADGQSVEQGQIGQLLVKSELMFSHYFQLPEETANVFVDGWLKTGDYARLDEDGELHLVGRTKNMLITGGLNVYPEEVELALKKLAQVEEVLVFGVPDLQWGERVIACIQWTNGVALSLPQVRKALEKELARYKWPKEIVSVQQFFYTSGGKIARQEMKKIALEELQCSKQSL